MNSSNIKRDTSNEITLSWWIDSDLSLLLIGSKEIMWILSFENKNEAANVSATCLKWRHGEQRQIHNVFMTCHYDAVQNSTISSRGPFNLSNFSFDRQ